MTDGQQIFRTTHRRHVKAIIVDTLKSKGGSSPALHHFPHLDAITRLEEEETPRARAMPPGDPVEQQIWRGMFGTSVPETDIVAFALFTMFFLSLFVIFLLAECSSTKNAVFSRVS